MRRLIAGAIGHYQLLVCLAPKVSAASHKNGRSHVVSHVKSRLAVCVFADREEKRKLEIACALLRIWKMVPRLRHRIGIETLKRELQANSLSSANLLTHTQTLTVEEHWDGHDYLSVDWNSRYEYHHNGAVGDKIPGFRTSAGK